MKIHLSFLALATLACSACCPLDKGRVVAKGAHLGAPTVHTSAGLNTPLAAGRDPLYRAPLPDVHWVRVERRDGKGLADQCDVIVYEKDWQKLAVGDCWSRCGPSDGKECKATSCNATVRPLRAERHAARQRSTQS